MAYLVLCNIGLIAILGSLTKLLGSVFLSSNPLVLNEYLLTNSIRWYFPGKKEEILYYGICLIGLFLYNIFLFFAVNKKWGARWLELTSCWEKKGLPYKLTLLGLLLILNLLMFKIKQYDALSICLQIFIWLGILLFPFYHFSLTWLNHLVKPFIYLIRKNLNIQRVCFVFIIAVIAQAFHIFYPFVFEKLYIMNEEFDIPEKTILTTGIVDNNAYYNEHSLLGINRKYNLDLDKGNESIPQTNTFFEIPLTPELSSFLKNNPQKFYYNKSMGAVCVNDEITYSNWADLRNLIQNESTKKQLDLFYIEYGEKKANKPILSLEENEFLDKNKFELHWQILNRWMFHHHNFVLGPINQYSLGKDIHTIFMQYGWLNIVVMKNIMENFGGISFQNYFKIWYSFYYIYYAIFIGILIFYFRQTKYILLGLFLIFGWINGIGFDFLILPPGLNPIRHFFDVFVIIFFYLYLKYLNRNFLIIAILFSLIGILNNVQFGFFCYIALVITVILKIYNSISDRKQKYKDWIILFISLLLGAYCYLFLNIGIDLTSYYYLNGVLGWPVKPKAFYEMFAAFVTGYSILILTFRRTDNSKYLALFLLLYSQGLLFYYVWGPSYYMFSSCSAIFTLTLLVLIKIAIEHINVVKHFEKIILMILLAISLIGVYIPGVHKYYSTKTSYYDIFKNHVNFQWDFSSAQFVSTMDPIYFREGVELIQRYSNENGIYILSKYDNILPLLAKKYSAMPYFDVPMFLLSRKDIDNCINTINAAKPEYLFIDTDIERNLNSDILDKTSLTREDLHDESVLRVRRLNLLKEIYNSIRGDYQPIEKSSLITVYKRKQ